MMKTVLALLFGLLGTAWVAAQDSTEDQAVGGSGESRKCYSGVYPHLTMRNDEGECGTGATVIWQGDLWAITYAPHKPNGSSDKLYQVTPQLDQKIYDGSVGGTPANRMIHRESNQLLIGPYLINAEKQIRVIPPSSMFGRLTGNARHLTDPQRKVYYATMEEGLYEVDVDSLAVHCFIRDGNAGAPKTGRISKLPGYHGKGLYSGQGRLFYANNGDRDPRVKVDPTIPSGALATWQQGGDWQLVRRNQFTEITGPGGIEGSNDPLHDPIWALGWDARSVLLALFDEGSWHYYRLPKGSHSYDGAHGWNTEWPRIREIGEDSLLATMHGTFWSFPATFSRNNSAGIAPRSNYLKVIGDFCRWKDRVVFGCDDSAASEFLNTRSFKAKHAGPGQSNSNLWFVDPAEIDRFGPLIGRGSVWLREDVKANVASDPYLFSGYDFRQLHLSHQSDVNVKFTIEVDPEGTDQWERMGEVTVPPNGAVSHLFDHRQRGIWLRLTSAQDVRGVTAHFQYRNSDTRDGDNDGRFDGVAKSSETVQSYGLMRSLAYNKLGLLAAEDLEGKEASYYELGPSMELVPASLDAPRSFVAEVAQPPGSITVDEASVIVEEDQRRYRLPKNDRYLRPAFGADRNASLSDYIGTHLARDANVTVSSTHESYVAKHAVDGSTSDEDRWIGANEGEVWIELDLGEAKTFRSIWLVTGWKNSSEYVAANFDVQVKRAGRWETLPGGAIRNNSEVQREIRFEQPVQAQFIRLVSDTDSYLRVYEIAPFVEHLEISRQLPSFATPRICREVATERDLLNLHGTFYELPARNAQGIAKIRPIATHNLSVHDFCSHNGLLLLTGIDGDANGPHIIRSADGKAAVWAGVVDDLWKLGKPRGTGGPWYRTKVTANQPSDPYLMTGYDQKDLTIRSSAAATIRLEVDVDGTGLWVPYQSFTLDAAQTLSHSFPSGFSAYWVRAVSDADTVATVLLDYK